MLFLRFMLAKLSCLHVVMLMDAPLSNALLDGVSACIGKDWEELLLPAYPPNPPHLTAHPSTPTGWGWTPSLPHPP